MAFLKGEGGFLEELTVVVSASDVQLRQVSITVSVLNMKINNGKGGVVSLVYLGWRIHKATTQGRKVQ